jgi:effector-binding domain-containing protein
MEYKVEVEERATQPVLSTRTVAAVQDLPQVMGRVFGEIMQYLGELGEQPAGPPFAAYYNMDMAQLDVEIGFPVARPLAAKGDLKPGEIPGGKLASTLHVGPYDQVGPAYEALSQWVRDNGYEATGVAYEFYLNDPRTTPPTQPETRIVFPLK